MTEAEWLASEDVGPMLAFLGDKVSGRAMRLFACACYRAAWQTLPYGADRVAAEVAERHADGLATDDELKRAFVASYLVHEFGGGEGDEEAEALLEDVYADALASSAYVREVAPSQEQRMAAALRDIFGNPFRPARLDPAAFTPMVADLAQAAYESRVMPGGELDPARLTVLADAVEEVGGQPEVLEHLRRPTRHIRGCWVLDLILGKR